MKKGRKIHRKDDLLIEKINKKFEEGGYKDKIVPYAGNIHLPSNKSSFVYDKDRINVILRCRENILYFAQHFFYIISLDKGKEKIQLHPFQRDTLRTFRDNKKTIMCCSRQVGKALALDTPIPTPNGWTTMGDIKEGDSVLDKNGNPTKVIKAWGVMYDRPCYKITFNTGESVIADAEHNWLARYNNGENKKIKTKDLENDYEKYSIDTCKKYYDYDCHTILNFEKIESVPVRCITVENEDEIFLCGKSHIRTKNTTLMTIYALWLITFFEYQSVVIVANKEKTAQEILERIKLAYQELPNWLKPGPKDGGWNKQETAFLNGSKISISATSADAIRGKSCSCLIVDEMAHIPHNTMNEFWSAVYPTVSSSKKAKVLVASTPNGINNLFYTLWSSAHKSKSGWGHVEVKWHDIPGRTQEWAEQEKLTLGIDKFEQEYECKFLEGGESPLDEELHNKLHAGCRNPKYELLDGKYKIYEEPDIENRLYCAGVDVGEGVGKCASTICILDITELSEIVQVATYCSNTTGTYDFARELHDIMIQWGKPPLAIERNNCGGTVVTELDKHFNYPRLINWSSSQGQNTNKHLKGVNSQTNTKWNAITNMFYWLRTKQNITLKDIDYLNEFKTYVRKQKGKNYSYEKINNDYFDDRVDAFMWSILTIRDEVVDQYFYVEARDGNNKPLKIVRTYEPYLRNDGNLNRYVGNESNKWGVLDPLMSNGNMEAHEFDPELNELNSLGWFLPNQDFHSSYKPGNSGQLNN